MNLSLLLCRIRVDGIEVALDDRTQAWRHLAALDRAFSFAAILRIDGRVGRTRCALTGWRFQVEKFAARAALRVAAQAGIAALSCTSTRPIGFLCKPAGSAHDLAACAFVFRVGRGASAAIVARLLIRFIAILLAIARLVAIAAVELLAPL